MEVKIFLKSMCIWNNHINKVTNKISKTVVILNKLRSFLPSGVLKTMYNTPILPHLIYGILAWGRHTNVIHKIQKRAIRIIAATKYNAHTEPLFNRLDPGRLYLKLLHSPHWPQHPIRFSYVYGCFYSCACNFFILNFLILHVTFIW